MIEYTTIRRVTVYAAARMEEELVAHFLKMGSTGYTVTECRGKGEHPVVDDPLGPNTSHVRIELLVTPQVADAIMAYFVSIIIGTRPSPPASSRLTSRSRERDSRPRRLSPIADTTFAEVLDAPGLPGASGLGIACAADVCEDLVEPCKSGLSFPWKRSLAGARARRARRDP